VDKEFNEMHDEFQQFQSATQKLLEDVKKFHEAVRGISFNEI
jgi:hypothetical protein